MNLLALLTMNNNERASFFCKKTHLHRIFRNVKNLTRPFIAITHFGTNNTFSYPHESDNTMLFSMLVLVLFTFFVGTIGISFNNEGMDFDILSKFLIPSINLLHQNSEKSVDWSEFVTNAAFSVSIAFFGIFIGSFLYKPVYSSLLNLNLFNLFAKNVSTKIIVDKIKNGIYDWSYNRGYIDAFFGVSLIENVRRLAKLNSFFDRRIIDGIPNGVGITSFFMGEVIKYVGGGRISSYILLYLFYVLMFFLVIFYFSSFFHF
ncbi:hypothetical protein L6164_037773 [Bauhinia variegata]|uniref:Uncharacterized protein n=1 Tax=Bauhinia variegata TaxID=167791 RepID=A0ACB9KL20_BAUVA|nr:hypothetical protein L6164_037773 [Bauhinia variegata]